MRALTEGTGRDLVPVLIGTLPAEYDAEPPELVERAQHDLRRRDARHHRRSSASEAAHRIESADWRSAENAPPAKCARPVDEAHALARCGRRRQCLVRVALQVPGGRAGLRAVETSGRRYMVGVHIDAALVVHDLEAKKVAPVCRQLHRSMQQTISKHNMRRTAPCHVHQTNAQYTAASLSRVRRRNHIRPKGWARALPHLHPDWARACHNCTGTGLAPATSAPGLCHHSFTCR